jgi:ribosomal protein S18 acetylase RimI-like enzyme
LSPQGCIGRRTIPYNRLFLNNTMHTMTDVPVVRPMRESELAFAASLTLGERWHSETLEEFEGFHARDPAGCLIAERAGRPLGIGVATAYGHTGFLGQIVVRPDARGEGVGDRIVGALVGHLERVGVNSIYLDATRAGVPLYERHGFVRVQPSLRFAGLLRGTAHPHVRPMRDADLDTVCALDRDWWGADRGFFIRRRRQLHPDLCHVLERDGAIAGYVLARLRGDTLWIGPWCAASGIDTPEALLGALLAPGATAHVHAGVLASGARAREALARLGLDAGDDPPWRMVRGPDAQLGRHPEALANGTSAKG